MPRAAVRPIVHPIRGVLAVVGAGLIATCRTTTQPSCIVRSVSVTPSPVTLQIGQSTTLTAAVNGTNCSATQLTPTWSSGSPAVGVQPNGTTAQITGVSATGGAVLVTASARGESGSAQVTVVPAPAIGLSATSLSYSASQGGANPASQFITITNSGGGSLTGLGTGTIVYGAGASGWLQTPVLSTTTAPATLTVQPVTGSLTPGIYTATIPVQSTVASNTPQNLSVTFTVTAAPVINLSGTTLNFNANQGGPNPASQFITITNSGGGTLSGLGTGTIVYGAGASGWLQAPNLSGTTAPATLTLQPVTGSLAPGSYSATIPVQSGVALNSPQTLTVNFTIAPSPAIQLSATSLTYQATQGGADPASQFITITNSGTGSLTGLATGTIVYGAGATGWLQAPNLSGTTAPATLTVQPLTGSLAPGSYTATIPVQSGVASNSPQNLTVTFNVAALPAISLSAGMLNFTTIQGGGNPASQFITITNSGGGTLSGLATGTISYGAGATGWLQAPNLSGTTAPATLTIQPVTGSLTPGAYSATIPVQSGVASNSPQTLTVNFTVSSASSVAPLVGNSQTGLVGFALNVRPAVLLTASGAPVSNVAVTFAVQSGGGSVVGPTVNTDANGVAQVGDWVLGAAPGANTLTATVSGSGITGNPVTFTATGVTSTFNITIQNIGPAFSPAVQAAFDSAVAKWQQIIYQDVPDFANLNVPPNTCFSGQPAIGPTNVDDILILAKFDSIDGPFNTLGFANWCFARSGSDIPFVGYMVFDTADVALLVSQGQLNSVILHEMGHVLGFGTTWSLPLFNCLQDPSNPPGTINDTYFSCPKARAMFDSIGGTNYTGGNKVPVENCGPLTPTPPPCGASNANGHWREPVFGTELMTPTLTLGVANPLSRLSAAAMEDVGYTVNYAGSDPYTHTFSLVTGGASLGLLSLGDDIGRGPKYVVDHNGRIVAVIRQ